MALNVHHAGDPDGAPVLAVHGLTGHGLRWRPLWEALPHRRWIAPDLRGHGRSPWVPPWTLDQHVADQLAMLDELGLDRVDVVGHSLGGAIATHLARTAPERVRRLVLLDPALGLDPEQMLAAAEDTRADEGWPTREDARAAKAGDWEGVAPELVDAEVDEHLEWRDGAWRWRYARACAVTTWSEVARPAVVPRAGTPTLIVPGTRAEYVRDEWLAACRAALGDDLVLTPLDTGHMVYLEQPAETAALLKDFLS